MQPMLLEARGPAQLAAYMTLEAELDAMLIHHITKEKVGAFAALTNTGKPDAEQHPVLQAAVVNLIALDYDPRQVTRPDGAVVTEAPGGMGWLWWKETYANARRWPTPNAKDAGDEFKAGTDLLSWIACGLPPSITLPGIEHGTRRGSIAQSQTNTQYNSRN